MSNKQRTLLEIAKSTKAPVRGRPARVPSEVELELALAWATGDVALAQVAVAVGANNPQGALSWIQRVLSRAVRHGLLVKG